MLKMLLLYKKMTGNEYKDDNEEFMEWIKINYKNGK